MVFIFAAFILGAFGLGWLSCSLYHTLTNLYGLREEDRLRDQWLEQHQARQQKRSA